MTLRKIAGKIGKALIRFSDVEKEKYRDIQNAEFWSTYSMCQPYTMTSVERMLALHKAVNMIIANRIPGDFVECGVWRGGSSMMVAQTLKNRGVTDRKLYLYDTFEGMSDPSKDDVDFRGASAKELMDENAEDKETTVWCLAEIDRVKENMRKTGYPEENIIYVQGKVEDTIPGTMPAGQISLLRLDTDWYASTRHELEHLFPKLARDGVFIIDDYGHWAGCRKAVDEYFKGHQHNILLHRIDYTGRIGIKTSSAIQAMDEYR